MPEPQTLVVPGSGGSVLAYALPANVLQYVESVVAVIDNSGGADAKPVLSIATGGGTPIADKTQGEAIPGGDTGRATWAHRLADEGGGGGIKFNKDNEGGYLDVTTNAVDANGWAMELLDTTGNFGIKLESAAAGKFGRVTAGQGAVVLTGTDTVILSGQGSPFLEVQGPNGGSLVLIKVANGNKLQVRNHLNQPIFEVRDDGSLHGKTGKTLSFDL